MEDAESVLVAGYRLDRYELLCPIASGGMASVWLAKLRGKRGFEKLFAIKTIKTELTTDARFQDMFLDEARIASGIQHPNVAQILDLGEQGDILYIVMEWVDGDSLAKIRRTGLKNGTPLTLGAALRILSDACAGLHAAHELADVDGNPLGIVHRDVSPHNILVATTGSSKVIDFGVAKARNRLAGETKSGIVKGKVRYMAPEQVQGKGVDRRADIWALGVCLYELVVGELPFDGESDIDVIRHLLADDPPPPPAGATPGVVEEVLARSLVRDPAARFETAADMQRAIDEAIDELHLPARAEDVAEYLRTNLPELQSKRKETVSKMLSAAQARDAGKGQSTGGMPVTDDAAFAPTVITSPAKKPAQADEATKPIQLKKKDGAKKRKKRAPGERGEEASKVTVATFVDDAPEATKRGPSPITYVLGVVAAGLVAWFVWPGSDTLRSLVGADRPPEPTSSPAAANSRPMPGGPDGERRGPVGGERGPKSAAAAPSASAPAAEASATASASASAAPKKARVPGSPDEPYQADEYD